MQRRTIASLVALQLVVACGYAVRAQDATRPSYARSSASSRTAALAGVPVSATIAPADKPEWRSPSQVRNRFVTTRNPTRLRIGGTIVPALKDEKR